MKREDILLTVGGSIAAIGVAFLIYHLQQQQSAQAAINSENQSEEIQSELANQQAQLAALPQISVPTISSTPTTLSTPSTTDTTNQATAPSSSDVLESIISSFQASDATPVTSTITPIASIGLGNNSSLAATGGAPSIPIDPINTNAPSGVTATPKLPANTSLQE